MIHGTRIFRVSTMNLHDETEVRIPSIKKRTNPDIPLDQLKLMFPVVHFIS